MEEVVVEARVRAPCKRFAIKDNAICNRSRLTQLPKELETGLDPPRIAKLLSESLAVLSQVGPPRYSLSSFSILR